LNDRRVASLLIASIEGATAIAKIPFTNPRVTIAAKEHQGVLSERRTA
jgi:hypothetical protein